jgi:hypothetical protein
LSENFPIQNYLKQGDALTPLLFRCALDYGIKKVQRNRVGLKLNGTYQLLVYADNMNLLGYGINIIEKNKENVIDPSRKDGLEASCICCRVINRMQRKS